jgi:hypothetical protein
MAKRPMNLGKIKQIFERLAKAISEIEDTPAPVEDDFTSEVPSLPTIRWGAVQSPRVVQVCGEARHELTEITDPEGVWSRSSVDDAVWNFTREIFDLPPGERQAGIRDAVADLVKRFGQEPSSWVVDFLVYGLHESCAGLNFGSVRFFKEEIDETVMANFAGFPRGTQAFARLETKAIDEESAIERAGNILDEHLMILNALCSQEMPSWIQVSRGDNMRPFYYANRVGRAEDSMETMRAYGHNRRIPLMGTDLDAVVKGSPGRAVSQMLGSAENDFNMRVLRGYQFAGAGCVDAHPERSFLMMAIALESVVLGKETKSELTYQLGSRVAHLIGNGLSGRKLVAKTVADLYERRSRVVHSGHYGVSRREAALMHLYCMASLAMLVASPVFAGFTKIEELEEWFKDRMLDGPNHLTPETQH